MFTKELIYTFKRTESKRHAICHTTITMITLDTARHRFETTVEGHYAFLEYVPFENGINITHTIVPSALAGRGIGSRLARQALDYARDHQLRVIPSCSFIRLYMEKNPDYKALL